MLEVEEGGRPRVRGVRGDQGGLEVGDQVVGRLDPDREAHEVARRGERRVGGRRVRHPRGVLDQALDAAEALGECPHLRAPDEVDGLLLGLDEERDHAAEVAHLPGGELVARVAREAGVEDALDPRVRLEELDHGMRVLAVALHPHGEGLHPAQHEPRVERPRDRAERLLQEAEALRDRRVVRAREAADDVRVAAEVLRRRVEDDVGAERERLLEIRRGEGVVDDEDRAGRVGGVRDRADVDEVEQRVRRGLDPDEARPLVDAPHASSSGGTNANS